MNQDKVVELLKNYRSYKFAINNGIAGFNPYDDVGMPRAGGYGSRAPRLGGGSTFQSEIDYQSYSAIVRTIDGVVADVLDDDQAAVIRRKYLDRNKRTLGQIAAEKHVDPSTVTRWHKIALKQLAIALTFVEVVEIINLDDVVQTA